MRRFLPATLMAALFALAATAYAAPVTHFRITKRDLSGEAYFTESRVKHRSLGLRAFDFRFAGGAYKLGSVGFWPKNERFYTVFKNHTDRGAYDVKISYVQLPLTGAESRRVVKKRGCRGSCRVRLAAPPKGDYVFMLTGYKFTNTGKKATEIQQIKIRPNVRGRYAEVAFRNAGRSKFDVELTYVYLVRRAFSHVGTGNGRINTGQIETNVGFSGGQEGVGFIRGFDFRILNGDHPIRRFVLAPITGENHKRGFRAQLLSKKKNTSIDVTVDYAILNENWAKRARK